MQKYSKLGWETVSCLQRGSTVYYIFILLVRCSSCAVWKTRVLISRTVVPLATPHNLEGLLEDLLRLLSTDCQNSLHTALLTLQRLLLERGDLLDGSDSGWRGVWLLEELMTRGTLGSRLVHSVSVVWSNTLNICCFLAEVIPVQSQDVVIWTC